MEDYTKGIDAEAELMRILNEEIANASRVQTSIPGLDDVIGGGIKAGQVGVVYSGAGVGRATLLCKLGHGVSKEGKNVLHISYQDMVQNLKEKFYTMNIGVPIDQLYSENNIDERRRKVSELLTDFKRGEHWVEFFIFERIEDIEKTINEKYPGTDLLIVDDLYLMDVEEDEDENPWKASQERYQQIKDLAFKLNIPVWVGMQLRIDPNVAKVNHDVKREMRFADVGVVITRTEEQRKDDRAGYRVIVPREGVDMVGEGCFSGNRMEVSIENLKDYKNI